MDINIARKTPPPGFEPAFITPPPLKEGPVRIRSLAIDVSGRCNMRCRYCAEKSTLPQRPPMCADTLDTLWKFLLPEEAGTAAGEQGRLTGDMFSLHMGSGEPLLNFPILQKLAEMAEQMRAAGNEPPRVFIVTNGTLLDEEIMDWLIVSGWNIKVSLDGPAAIHDRWRLLPGAGSTYRRVSAAITYLAQRAPDRFSVSAVLCRGNDPAAVFQTIENLGVRQIDLMPVAHTDDSIIPGPADIENYREFIMNYAARFLENGSGNTGAADTKPAPTALNVFYQCMMRLMGYRPARIYCSAGRSYLGVGSQGDLYPCGRFVGLDREYCHFKPQVTVNQPPEGLSKVFRMCHGSRGLRIINDKLLIINL